MTNEKCKDCKDCENSHDCDHCKKCKDCQYCKECEECEDCYYCHDCNWLFQKEYCIENKQYSKEEYKEYLDVFLKFLKKIKQ